MVQVILSQDNWEKDFLGAFGRYASYTPVTKTTSNITGEETLTSGTPTNISCFFIKTNQRFDFEKNGLTEVGDAVLLAKYSDGVVKDGIITIDSQTYRIRQRYDVPGTFDKDGNSFAFCYTACALFKEL